MNPQVLEQILSCQKLPSLPAVAMRVVELTQDQKVSMRSLAETIQNDQALTVKILKTVNSSLFGLRQRCSSINQAIIMLGMSAVKTLALGFSLVSEIKESSAEFNLNDHWRRALFSAVSAKTIASKAGLANAEECFLGGLLQDVGMIAMHQALGQQYASAIAEAAGDHRAIAKLELARFEIQHADLGAMLAERWKLPESLVMPIKYHERPTAAPQEHVGVCRAVGLGNIAADFLTSSDPTPHLRKFYERAEQWFGLDESTADGVLKAITSATREVGTLLNVATGELPDTGKLLAQAKAELERIVIPSDPDSDNLAPIYSLTARSSHTDELTGASTHARFEQVLIAAFEQARAGVCPLSVALVEVDGVQAVHDICGEEARDSALIFVAGKLSKAFGSVAGLIARFDESRFGVIVNRHDRAAVSRTAELARAAVAAEPLRLIAAKTGAPAVLNLTISAGVVTADAKSIAHFPDCATLLRFAEAALAAAHKSGQNTVRVYQPEDPAVAAEPVTSSAA